MINFLIVFFGGGLGSVGRYLLSKLMSQHFPSPLPLGTLTANIFGCFLIGIILGIVERYKFHPQISLLFATGFCGGFTTFSSFAYESNLYLKEQDYIAFLFYPFLSIVWGFSATFLGVLLSRNF